MVRGIPPPPGRPPQSLTLSVDGIVVQQAALSGKPQSFDVTIPAARTKSATIGFALSSTFVPGPQDRRELGMIIDRVGLSAASRLRVPTSALLPAVGGALALALALALVSGSWLQAVLLAAAGAAGQSALLAIDAAYLGDVYVWRLLRIDLACLAAAAIVLVVARLTLGRRSHGGAEAPPYVQPGSRGGAEAPLHGQAEASARQPDGDAGRGFSPADRQPGPIHHPGWFDRGWRLALPLVLLVCALRVGVFVHPLATIGDSIFHVHRAELVQRGSYFFTSVTPRPFFEFPYAPGLYVVASPLWKQFPTQLEHVMLLRTLGLAVDALAALAVFAAVRRYWGVTAGVVAAGLFQLVPIGLHTFCTANLTNAFSQSVFTAALMIWLWSLSRSRVVVATLGFAALLALAFLSHFSTLSTGVPIVLAVGAALWFVANSPTKQNDERSRWVWTLVALAVALGVSYAIYYSHFHAVYATTLERVMAREGAEASRSMVAPVSVKLGRFIYAVRAEYFGLPLLAGALTGVGVALARRSRDAMSLALGAWLLVVSGFLALGVFTPIEMRAALAGQPLVVAFLGLATTTLWRWTLAGRALVVAVVAAVIVRGGSDWLLCLGLLAK
jgi:hypothetical protein